MSTVVALSLSVPSFLLGTAGTLSISARALGGIVGITIFTAIYDNKYAVNLPEHVTSALAGLGDSAGLVGKVLGALASPAPPALALSAVPGLSPEQIPLVLGAVSTAQAASWKYVWVAIACIILANAFSCCFLKSVQPTMTAHVESALEKSELREQQLSGKAEL